MCLLITGIITTACDESLCQHVNPNSTGWLYNYLHVIVRIALEILVHDHTNSNGLFNKIHFHAINRVYTTDGLISNIIWMMRSRNTLALRVKRKLLQQLMLQWESCLINVYRYSKNLLHMCCYMSSKQLCVLRSYSMLLQ